MIETILFKTGGQGLYEITNQIQDVVRSSGICDGICNILVKHTSASLTIQENADPSAKRDLENWLKRLVAEEDPIYTHTLEGADDMPSHIKSAITSATLSIPVSNNSLALGTWQGIYLWEHRRRGHNRNIVLHVGE